MPKESHSAFLARIVQLYPKVFKCDNSILYCCLCESVAPATRIFNVKQHLETTKHKAAEARKTKEINNQTLLTKYNNGSAVNTFHMDICETFIEANIPLHKIAHPSVVKFLETHTKLAVPCENTIRQKCLPVLYKECIEKMRALSANKYIWATLDETQDCESRCVASFIFGVMDENGTTKRCYLLNIEELIKVNASTVSAFFINSLNILWPDGIKYDRVLLVVTDAAAYMLKAMKSLQVLFPKMLHTTCFAHGLHRLADFIQEEHPLSNKLVAKGKAVFVKAPSRRHKFKEACPNIPLPPEPVLIRWGTWIEAAVYYCKNFVEVRTVIDSFDENEAESIRICKELLSNEDVKLQLVYINNNFKIIPTAINQLETQGIDLNTSLNIIYDVKKSISQITDKKYEEKMRKIFDRNPGYAALKEIQKVLCEGVSPTNSYVQNLLPNEIILFKYCPTTSCDVERSFSIYKHILSDRRRSFKFENLKQHIINCNA